MTQGGNFSIIFLEAFSFLVGLNNLLRCGYSINTQQSVRPARYFLTFGTNPSMLPQWRRCLGTRNSGSFPSPAAWSFLPKDDWPNRNSGSGGHWAEDSLRRRWKGKGVVIKLDRKKHSNWRQNEEHPPTCERLTYLENLSSNSAAALRSSLLGNRLFSRASYPFWGSLTTSSGSRTAKRTVILPLAPPTSP